MKVSIVRPEAPGDRVDLCIVVDVLRATTTAAVLCHRLGELCVLRTPADLEHLPMRPRGYVLFSELAGMTADIPRFDNSPVLARDADIAGRIPVLVTTNGTLAVGVAAQLAREVVLAGFVNLSAIVDYVRRRRLDTIAVMPAGNIAKAQCCFEDDGCAESIASLLSIDAGVDVATVIAACRADDRILRRRANEPGLAADVDLCFELDAMPVVPRVVGAADQRWFGVVRA